jgi:hypothetical protein
MASRLERRVLKKQEREEKIAAQRAKFNARQRNKRIVNYTILGIVVLALGFGAWQIFKPQPAGEQDALAKCLTERGAIMYGTDWCPHCQEQKRLFGRSFQFVTYVNCDLNAAACQAAGIEGYPTWVLRGERLPGTLGLDLLAETAGCVA